MPKTETDIPGLEHPWLSRIEGTLFMQRYPATAEDELLRAALDAIERLVLYLQSPYAWVVDLGGVARAPSHQRRLFVEHERRLAKHDAEFSRGSGIYVQSRIVRGVVTAVYWMIPPSYPVKVTGSLEQAERWCRQQLIDDGCPISPEPVLLANGSDPDAVE